MDTKEPVTKEPHTIEKEIFVAQFRNELEKASDKVKFNEDNAKQDTDDFILTQDSIKQYLSECNATMRKNPDAVNYTDIVKLIVFLSQDYLMQHTTDKTELRCAFVKFFKRLLSSQVIFLFLILFINACDLNFHISDNVLIMFMTSIFVETLGCIILMIKFAFKSDEEVKILEVLNKIVENFQK